MPPSLSRLISVNLGRALLISAVVGTLLVLINHGDHLLDEPVCRGFFFKLALSYLVPFAVSMLSAALAARSEG